MPSAATSTKATVRNPERAGEILDSYHCRGVQVVLQEKDTVWSVEMTDNDNEEWDMELPQALRLECLPSPEEFEDETEWMDEVMIRLMNEGDAGFLALLRDLAPYLETPLLILGGGARGGWGYAASVWRVEPGAKEVETLGV